MRFVKFDKQYFCGIDLHAKSIYLCLINNQSHVFIHRKLPADPEVLLKTLEPYKDDLVVGVESTFNWYWIADLCHNNNITFALGNAYYMKCIHGAKQKNDRIDSKKIAELLRSGMFPPAYAYPKEKRTIRDLLRRRHRLVMQRAELYRHIKLTFYQLGKQPPTLSNIKILKYMNALIEQLGDDESVFTLQTDLSLIQNLNLLIKKIEKQILHNTKNKYRQDYNILLSINGLGNISALNILYEIDTIDRFPTHQRFSSYCRVVKSTHTSAGKNYPSKGNKIGNAYLKWTFSEITVHTLEFSEKIKMYYEKLLKKFGKGKAKSILSHKFAIAIYYMLKNKTVFNEDRFVCN